MESNPNVLELSIATAAKALAIALPRIEPLKQEKLFVAISLALEQVQYGLHLLDLEKSKSICETTSLKKAIKHVITTIKDGKLLAIEGRESPVICGYIYGHYNWGLNKCEDLICHLEKGHEGSHVA